MDGISIIDEILNDLEPILKASGEAVDPIKEVIRLRLNILVLSAKLEESRMRSL